MDVKRIGMRTSADRPGREEVSTEQDTIAMMILNWAKSTFGPVAFDPAERAARLLEEAAEVAQAMGVKPEVARAIVGRTYSRPVGEVDKEVGGVLVCAYSICALIGKSPAEALYEECNRVTGRDRSEWVAKHEEKVKDGTANVSVVR